jgi:hypothetical protein
MYATAAVTPQLGCPRRRSLSPILRTSQIRIPLNYRRPLSSCSGRTGRSQRWLSHKSKGPATHSSVVCTVHVYTIRTHNKTHCCCGLSGAGPIERPLPGAQQANALHRGLPHPLWLVLLVHCQGAHDLEQRGCVDL